VPLAVAARLGGAQPLRLRATGRLMSGGYRINGGYCAPGQAPWPVPLHDPV
jgi:hypothetical protein